MLGKRDLLTSYQRELECFPLEKWDVGLAKDVEHMIRISDPRPLREKLRHLTSADIHDVWRHLQKLFAAGIINESRSPYA